MFVSIVTTVCVVAGNTIANINHNDDYYWLYSLRVVGCINREMSEAHPPRMNRQEWED